MLEYRDIVLPTSFTSSIIVAAGINRGGIPVSAVPTVVVGDSKITQILIDITKMTNATTLTMPINNRIYNLIIVGI